MIRMVGVATRRGKLFSPQIFCDHCGDRIERSGNVLWLVQDGQPVSGEMFHTHKHCNHAFESAQREDFLAGGPMYYWLELRRLPVQLAANLELEKEPWVRRGSLTPEERELVTETLPATARACITERLHRLNEEMRSIHENAREVRHCRREGGSRSKEWRLWERLDIAFGEFEHICSFFNDWLGKTVLRPDAGQDPPGGRSR